MNDAPIRVAHVVGKVVTGGVDTVVMNYYRQVDREKIQFDFLMDGRDETPIDDEIRAMGGRVHKLEPYERNMLRNMRECYRIFKNGNYQIVHSHLNTLSVFPLCAAWAAGLPIRIAHNHSTAYRGEGTRTLMKHLLRPFAKLFANRYAACSEYAGAWLFGKCSCTNGNVKIIRNAIDIDRYVYLPTVRQQARHELGVVEDRLVMGHVGRFVYQKNHDFLIDVFAEMKRVNSNAILLLVGDGELLDTAKGKVASLGLLDSVIFTGVRQDTHRLYQAMDVFIFPSFYEGLGLAAIEAQAAGLPTLLSDRVPQEASITPYAQSLSLTDSAVAWAERALSQIGRERRSTQRALSSAGFEIAAAAKDLEDWYAH